MPSEENGNPETAGAKDREKMYSAARESRIRSAEVREDSIKSRERSYDITAMSRRLLQIADDQRQGRIKFSEDYAKAAEEMRLIAEALRISSEDVRQTSEDLRLDAEGRRVTSEGARASREENRMISEEIRQSSEMERALAEMERISAEDLRKAAEDLRIVAEMKRYEIDSLRSTSMADRDSLIQELKRSVDDLTNRVAALEKELPSK